MIISETDYLEHFGVKGMHWGVRKDRTPAEAARVRRRRRIGKTVVLGGLAATLALGAHHANQTMKYHADVARLKRAQESFSKMTATLKPTVSHGRDFSKVIVMGPIGSTSISRLNGAIPMPKIGGF